MATKQRENVLASIWAEGFGIGIVLFNKTGKTYQPLASWKSNLAAFDFGFVNVLKQWQNEHGLNKVIMNLPSDYKGKVARHPIRVILPVRDIELRPEIEPLEGLASLFNCIQQDRIDFSQFSKDRLLEQVKRLDTSRDPVVFAFLQAVTEEAPSGVGVSRRKNANVD